MITATPDSAGVFGPNGCHKKLPYVEPGPGRSPQTPEAVAAQRVWASKPALEPFVLIPSLTGNPALWFVVEPHSPSTELPFSTLPLWP
jgi:hypothetical protein